MANVVRALRGQGTFKKPLPPPPPNDSVATRAWDEADESGEEEEDVVLRKARVAQSPAGLRPFDSATPDNYKRVKPSRRIDTVRTAAHKQRVRLHDVDLGAKCLTCKEKCPGFEYHFWRKLCRHCHCQREDHDVWLANDTPAKKAAREASSLNETQAELPADRALARQDPQHDHDVEACAHVKTEEQRETFQQLAHERRGSIDVARHLDELEQAGQGVASCTECSLPVDPVDLLRAEVIKSDFHSACFKCAECEEHLAHNTYYAYHRRPLCGRCHAEKFYPRCSGCDELILDKTYVRADGKTWHTGHLRCIDCDTSLAGQPFSHSDRGHLVCLGCYEANHAPMCTTCSQPIKAGEEAVQAGDQFLHKNAACFRCFLCEVPLLDSECIAVEGSVYCLKDYEKLTQQICATCCHPITGSYMEVASNKYHEDCFVCAECKLPLGKDRGMAAYPVPDGIMCYDHALSSRMASCVLQPRGQVARPKNRTSLKEELL